MTVFLIDYENVNAGGMSGIESLGESDKIYLFYSNNSDKLTFALHQSLCSTKAKVEILPVLTGTQHSLDFQLVSYLGYLIAQNPSSEYVIVSKDSGFGSAVSFWEDRKIKIMQANNLLKESSKTIAGKLKELLPADYKSELPHILQTIEKYKTKQGINNALVKEFGSDKACELYKVIKPLLTDKKTK